MHSIVVVVSLSLSLLSPFPQMHHKSQHKKGTGVSYAKDKSATQEEFFAMVRERLLAVHKDRETMTQKVRDQARKQGNMSFDEIMVSDTHTHLHTVFLAAFIVQLWAAVIKEHCAYS